MILFIQMEITLTTPALLFPAIAILMLGYVNRYLGTASVIRTFKKDYDAGYKHIEVVSQINILKKRIELSRQMLTAGILALLFACLSMFLIFAGLQLAGIVIFSLSLIAMIISMFISLYETSLSNKALLIEVNDILKKEQHK